MANVRYMGGGSDATLGTKDITENGTYNASSDDLDGYSQVTVDVAGPTGTKILTYTSNGLYTEDVEDFATADITVNVPSVVQPTQEKGIIATTNQQTVTPDSGYLLSSVTVNPQHHSASYRPAENELNSDMGIIHNYRYVNTSGMITPTGELEVSIDSNGDYTEDVTGYSSVSIEVDVPVSGTLGTKNIITNGTYTAIDDNLDGYSEVNVNVPQNATLGIKTITNNGNYYATTDGYDGYSRVDVNVAGSTLQANKNVTATTSQQIVQPDQGYDGLEQVTVNPQVHTATYTPVADTAANDMGANNNYRYVNTSGMHLTNMLVPSNNPPSPFNNGAHLTATGNGYAITSYNNIMPSNASPVSIGAGSIYRAQSSGYAIQYYTNETPSDIDPPIITTGNMIRATANGYLYATQQGGGLVASGSFTSPAAGSTISIACGFQPKKICIVMYTGTNSIYVLGYDVDMDSNRQIAGWKSSSSSSGCQQYALPNSSNNGVISEITSNSFVYRGGTTSAGKTTYYFAIG